VYLVFDKRVCVVCFCDETMICVGVYEVDVCVV
jgi:hypothetical protein